MAASQTESAAAEDFEGTVNPFAAPSPPAVNGRMTSIEGPNDSASPSHTLDEPVLTTVKRDVLMVGRKLKMVLLPRAGDEATLRALRDWDLWGPLVLCLVLALYVLLLLLCGRAASAACVAHGSASCLLLIPQAAFRRCQRWPDLSHVRAGVCASVGRLSYCYSECTAPRRASVRVVGGSAPERKRCSYTARLARMHTHAHLLHAAHACHSLRSFFQSVCVLGYCIFPLVIAALVNKLLPFAVTKMIVVVAAFLWATRASIVFMQGLVPEERRALAAYPVLLFYVAISWMVFVT